MSDRSTRYSPEVRQRAVRLVQEHKVEYKAEPTMTDPKSRFCDDLGPEAVIDIHEPKVKLHAILVVDYVAAGPSIGGVRMARDVSLGECFRLARAMTYKNAAARGWFQAVAHALGA